MSLTTFAILVTILLLIALVTSIVRRRSHTSIPSARRPTMPHDLIPLASRLRPGDVVSILDRSGRPDRGTRETTYRGRHADGRLVLRTSPWCRMFRRPASDLVAVVRVAKSAA
jgi:hypothetical protein